MADQRGSIGPSVLQLPRDGPENLLYGGVGTPHGGVPQLVLPHHGVGGLDDPSSVGAPDAVELSLQDFQSSGDAGTNSGSDDDDSTPRGDSNGGGQEENDTRRARRILANRKSAQRSRTRRMQYIHEIERKVDKMKTESEAMAQRLIQLRGHHQELSGRKIELKNRVAALMHQSQHRETLCCQLQCEIAQLRSQLTGTSLANRSSSMQGNPPSQGMMSISAQIAQAQAAAVANGLQMPISKPPQSDGSPFPLPRVDDPQMQSFLERIGDTAGLLSSMRPPGHSFGATGGMPPRPLLMDGRTIGTEGLTQMGQPPVALDSGKLELSGVHSNSMSYGPIGRLSGPHLPGFGTSPQTGKALLSGHQSQMGTMSVMPLPPQVHPVGGFGRTHLDEDMYFGMSHPERQPGSGDITQELLDEVMGIEPANLSDLWGAPEMEALMTQQQETNQQRTSQILVSQPMEVPGGSAVSMGIGNPFVGGPSPGDLVETPPGKARTSLGAELLGGTNQQQGSGTIGT